MIWILLLIVLLATFLYAAAPLYARADTAPHDSEEIRAYRREIAALNDELDADDISAEEARLLKARKTLLERQIIAAGTRATRTDTGPARGWVTALAATMILGGVGIYSQTGRPDLGTQAATPAPTPTHKVAASDPTDPAVPTDKEMEKLVEELGARLAAGEGDLRGWQIYARSLMTMERYDDALAAYDDAVAYSDNDPAMISERDQAAAYVAARRAAPALPGPTADDIANAENMSEADRAAMVQGMVDGLSQKLADDPSDVEGWVRLLRSRGVMGQIDQAVIEIERMQAAFADQPEVMADILQRSGWREDAP